MASLSVSANDKALALVLASFKDLSITQSAEAAAPAVSQLTLDNASIVSGSNTIMAHLATLIPLFAQTSYTALEQGEIDQWLTLSAASSIPAETLDKLEETLKFRTTLLGEKLSIADVAVYARIKDTVAGWTDEERTGEKGRRYTLRWVDFVQNTPELGLEGEKVVIDPSKVLVYLKPEEAPKKEKKPATAAETAAKDGKDAKKYTKNDLKKDDTEKDAAKDAVPVVAAGQKTQKKEKKEKPKREPPPPKAEPVISPSQLDLRVGHILHCRPHPNADSLFVSTIAMGDSADSAAVTPASELTSTLPPGVLAAHNPFPPCRTVCSGLNGLVPIEEMQNRHVVVVANLKPAKMRGINSCAMVLAASPPPPLDADPTSHKKEMVELVSPPKDAKTGEKLFFEGYDGAPETQLNPKKKVWEQIQPGFVTSDSLEVYFDREKAGWNGENAKGKAEGQKRGRLVSKAGGVCLVPTLKGANCS